MNVSAQATARRHWWLILNGKCAGDEAVREGVCALRERGITLDVRVTWEAGDAVRYVDEAIAAGVDSVIAAGGDGTLNEVARALALNDRDAGQLPSLALLPMGTANDFATAAQIPTAAADALDLVADAPAHAIDLLRIDADGDEYWCANLASGGFGTEVTVETDDGLKKVLGSVAYMITGVAKLGSIEPIPARLHGPGFQWDGGFVALGVGNGRQAGGGQELCPDAVIDDGLLDLTIVPELEGEVGETVGSLLTEGKQAALDRIAVRKALAWVEVESPEAFTLNLDGEPIKATRFRIDCVAGRVRMHLPPDCPLLRPPPPAAKPA